MYNPILNSVRISLHKDRDHTLYHVVYVLKVQLDGGRQRIIHSTIFAKPVAEGPNTD